MSQSKSQLRMNRRAFLRNVALVSGALFLPAGSVRAETSALTNSTPVDSRTIKVGILLPSSSLYPVLGQEILDGMRQFAHAFREGEPHRAVDFLPESIGVGSRTISTKARALIEKQDVDVLVAGISVDAALGLGDLLADYHVPLIVLQAGANVVRHVDQHPWIFYNTLHMWQSSMALGRWAAHSIGKRAFSVSSFYDGGYDASYAFELGVEDMSGEILGRFITHTLPGADVPSNSGSLHAAMAAIRRAAPDFVYAAYCGDEAIAFAKAYASAGLAGQLPLFGLGLFADDGREIRSSHAAQRLKMASSWDVGLDNVENLNFVRGFHKKFGCVPGPFAVLGHETLHLIVAAASKAKGYLKSDAYRSALETIEFASPRGAVKMMAQAHTFEAPLYLHEVDAGATSLRNQVVAQLPSISSLGASGRRLQSGLKTGWLNPYLMI